MARPVSPFLSPLASPRAQILAALIDAILQWDAPSEASHENESVLPCSDQTVCAEDIVTATDTADGALISG